MIAVVSSGLGVLVLLLGIGRYVVAVRRLEVLRAQKTVAVALALSVVFATAGGVWSWLVAEPSWLVLALSGFCYATTALTLLLHSQRRVPLGTLRVKVGDRLLPFTALTPDERPFGSDALRGKRWLFKFFRGEWCPFCQAELKHFDAMQATLRRYGVQVIALSKDTPEAARLHRQRDSLGIPLLCDPELRVIRSYGLEHRKALEVSAGPRISLGGMSVGTRPAFRHMAVPTTLLLDEDGVIRWIDQTDDYKVRSSTERVLAAVHQAFGDGTSPRELPVVQSPTAELEELCAEC